MTTGTYTKREKTPSTAQQHQHPQQKRQDDTDKQWSFCRLPLLVLSTPFFFLRMRRDRFATRLVYHCEIITKGRRSQD